MNPTVRRMLKLGALPLLIYPFVAMASVMSLAGDDRQAVPLLLTLVAKSFLWGTLAYPLIYLPCAALASVQDDTSEAAWWFAAVPVWFLKFLLGLFVAWLAIGMALGPR